MRRLFLTAVTTLLYAMPLAQAHMPSEEEWTQNIGQWQARMKTMHEQMAKIAEAEDPQERQRLLAEHWQLMGEQMNDMNMMGGPMMGGPMMGGHMMGGHMTGGPMTGGHMMSGMCGCPMCGMMHQMMHQHVMMMHGDKPGEMHGGTRRQMRGGMHEGMHGGMHGEE